MDNQRRLQLANRMHLQLLRELGHGIDVKRMLGDIRYAADVLLVCDAMPEHGLHELSARFRQSGLDEAVPRPTSWVQDHGGFEASLPATAAHRFDLDIDLSGLAPPMPRAGAWQSAARWLGGW